MSTATHRTALHSTARRRTPATFPRRITAIQLAVLVTLIAGAASSAGPLHEQQAVAGPPRAEQELAARWARRDRWQRPDRIIELLRLPAGAVVADLGAGKGYFTAKLARAVGPAGRVLALDLNAEALAINRSMTAAAGLSNVEYRVIPRDDPGLTQGEADLIFINSTWHFLPERLRYAARLRELLRPGGRVAVLGTGHERLPRSARHYPGATTRYEVWREAEAGVRALARAAGLACASLPVAPEQPEVGALEDLLRRLRSPEYGVVFAFGDSTRQVRAIIYGLWASGRLELSEYQTVKLVENEPACGDPLAEAVEDASSAPQDASTERHLAEATPRAPTPTGRHVSMRPRFAPAFPGPGDVTHDGRTLPAQPVSMLGREQDGSQISETRAICNDLVTQLCPPTGPRSGPRQLRESCPPDVVADVPPGALASALADPLAQLPTATQIDNSAGPGMYAELSKSGRRRVFSGGLADCGRQGSRQCARSCRR